MHCRLVIIHVGYLCAHCLQLRMVFVVVVVLVVSLFCVHVVPRIRYGKLHLTYGQFDVRIDENDVFRFYGNHRAQQFHRASVFDSHVRERSHEHDARLLRNVSLCRRQARPAPAETLGEHVHESQADRFARFCPVMVANAKDLWQHAERTKTQAQRDRVFFPNRVRQCRARQAKKATRHKYEQQTQSK
jgi:hypothetical protein